MPAFPLERRATKSNPKAVLPSENWVSLGKSSKHLTVLTDTSTAGNAASCVKRQFLHTSGNTAIADSLLLIIRSQKSHENHIAFGHIKYTLRDYNLRQQVLWETTGFSFLIVTYTVQVPQPQPLTDSL